MVGETALLGEVVLDAERDRWFAGTLLRFVADARETDGKLTVMEQRARRGFSPPLHVHHREDTAMLVLEGALTVVVGGDQQIVAPGGFVWLPRDVPHTFRIDSDEAHLLEFATPGGVERFHLDASDPAEALLLPPAVEPDVERMLGAVGAYGIEIIGPPLG